MFIQKDVKADKNRYIILFCLIVLTGFLCLVSAVAAETESEPVRVGYYENEVFQEGAQKDAVKTGYAYEYYRKLSDETAGKAWIDRADQVGNNERKQFLNLTSDGEALKQKALEVPYAMRDCIQMSTEELLLLRELLNKALYNMEMR